MNKLYLVVGLVSIMNFSCHSGEMEASKNLGISTVEREGFYGIGASNQRVIIYLPHYSMIPAGDSYDNSFCFYATTTTWDDHRTEAQLLAAASRLNTKVVLMSKIQVSPRPLKRPPYGQYYRGGGVGLGKITSGLSECKE